MQGGNHAILVRQNEEVAVFGLPRITACIFDGSGVPTAHEGHGGEEIGFAAERGLLLILDGLQGEGSIPGVLLNVLLRLRLGVASNNEEGGAGERGGEKHKGKDELGAEAQAFLPSAKKVGERADTLAIGGQTRCSRHEEDRLTMGPVGGGWAEGTVGPVL